MGRPRILLLLVLLLQPLSGLASTPVGVALLTDGPALQLEEVEAIFRTELLDLAQDEFAITFLDMPADWSAAGIDAALDRAYQNPEVDLVLVVGFAANQYLVNRTRFDKPTFLPLVFNPNLEESARYDTGSGRTNLNFLSDRVTFREDLEAFQRVSAFSNAALLADSVIINSSQRAAEAVRSLVQTSNLSFVGHDGSDHRLVDRLPPDTDAVLLGGLPRMPDPEFDQMLADMLSRGLPIFSLVSDTALDRGALAANTDQTDYRRLARRNALNMQAVLLGERAQDQRVYYERKRRLTINMDSARAIGLSPRFDVLSEAVLVNEEPAAVGPELTLLSVARLSLSENLDLAVSELDVRIGEQSVLFARSNLLPQINLSGSYTARRDDELARTAAFPERSTAGIASLNQLIYSEAARSGYDQEKFFQEARVAGYGTDRLDRLLDGTTAFLQALRAVNQLEIQQDNLNLTQTNLELARDRVRAGSASNADIYRWEARLAGARSDVLAALAIRNQAYDSLNQILNQPMGTQPRLAQPAPDDPFTMTGQEFDKLISNPRRFQWFVEYSLERGLETAPELANIDAQLGAIERDELARRRAFWLPDVSLQAQYTDSINASGRGAGTPLDELDDWSVSVNASWPLLDSGARRSQLSRARLQREQLVTQRAAIAQRVEQRVRAAMYEAQASYVNIELSESAAVASRQNLELVSDAYRQGAVSIIDLLDAQNQSLQADLAANNAVQDFLIDIMNYERAVGSFDFLLPQTEQQTLGRELSTYIEEREAQRAGKGVQR
ncbi:MAG: TolC family protein [Pseudomonadota bacterium]